VEDDLERDVEECFVLDDFFELCFRLQDLSTIADPFLIGSDGGLPRS
jgi:hypothetical protein